MNINSMQMVDNHYQILCAFLPSHCGAKIMVDNWLKRTCILIIPLTIIENTLNDLNYSYQGDFVSVHVFHS